MNKIRDMKFTLVAFLFAFSGSTVFAIDSSGSSNIKLSRLKRTPTDALLKAQVALNGPLVNATKQEIDAGTAIKARATFVPQGDDAIGCNTKGEPWVSGDRWYSPSSGLIKLSQVDDANKDKRLKTSDELKLSKFLSALGADNDEDKMTVRLSELAPCDDKGFPKILYYISEAQMRLTYGPEYAQKISAAQSDIRIARSAMGGDYQRSAEDQSSEYAKLLSALGLTFENEQNNLLASLEAIRSFMNQAISEGSILDFSSFKSKNRNFDINALTNKDLQEMKEYALKNTRFAGNFGLSNPYERLRRSFENLYNNRFAPTSTTPIEKANLNAAREYLKAKTIITESDGTTKRRPNDREEVKFLDDAFTLLNKYLAEEDIVAQVVI